MMRREIFLGSDHAGFNLKEEIKKWLEQKGHRFVDCGCFSQDPVHYPNFAFEVCKKVALNRDTMGILICATGIGMSIAANRIKKIRAALCIDTFMACRARKDNDANVLCLGAKKLSGESALRIVDAFLSTPFSKGEKEIRSTWIIEEKGEKINQEIEKAKKRTSIIPEHVIASFGKH